MSRKSKQHFLILIKWLADYAKARTLDFHVYSEFHMRIIDDGYTVLDAWTTGRYYVLQTDYSGMSDTEMLERTGEKGNLHINKVKLYEWLDKLFYATEMEES